jgi:hypothetical protein
MFYGSRGVEGGGQGEEIWNGSDAKSNVRKGFIKIKNGRRGAAKGE